MNLSNSDSGEGFFDNKYLIGIVMVIINLGARFIVNELNEEQKKLINSKYLKLKILGTGEIKTNIEISAHFASKQALTKIEKAGGKINIVKK